MNTLQSAFMQEALHQAKYAEKLGEVPIGAVIVFQNEVIAKAHNNTRGLNKNSPDPTGHAEIIAIRLACKKLNVERLIDCDLYVSLEPCAMCAAAISFARIRRLYYSANDPKGGAVEHGTHFYNSAICFHAPELYPGLCEQQSQTLLKQFFQRKRK